MQLINVFCSPVGRFSVFFLIRVLAPLAIIFSIAWPEHTHFRTDYAPPAQEVLTALSQVPMSDVLDEVANMSLAVSLDIPQADHPAAARKILDGRLEAPTFSASPIELIGWPQDLIQRGPTFQLIMASLAAEGLLLEEFERSNERALYLAARDRILAFARWEAQQTQPIAFLWNDHAVAARIPVLIRLWRHLRNDKATTPELRTEIIALVIRSGGLLAKNSQFTVRTNHGVMQNIALLQIGAAFPDLPQASQWRRLAVERLELQLAFYVSDEGVVLEHSAEYHIFGSELLAYALRLTHLNSISPPARLANAVRGTANFSRVLMRPDGTLPLVGNTAGGHSATLITAESLGIDPVTRKLPPFLPPSSGSYLYPGSGYAVWWNNALPLSQTVTAWAKHDRHGHKHADEPSLHFWSRGYDWITATGYWPYGDPQFADANGWLSSNAPHLANEPANSVRTVRLFGTGNANGLSFIDLENQRHNGFSVRRQILQVQPEIVLILDFFNRADKEVETLWTSDPRVTLTAQNEGTYVGHIEGEANRLVMTFASAGGNRVNLQPYRGSSAPFAGWVMVGRQPIPASAVMTRQGNREGAIATLVSIEAGHYLPAVIFDDHAQPTHWRTSIDLSTGPVAIERNGETIDVVSSGKHFQVPVLATPDIANQEKELHQAMTSAIKAYPPWRDLKAFTVRLYVAIGLLWLSIEFGLFFVRRRSKVWIEVVPILAWGAVALWVHRAYLI